jgi:hypothetical protein
MSQVVIHQLREAAAAAASRYSRLVLLVGPAGSGKTPILQQLAGQQHWPLISLSAALARALQDVAPDRRPHEVLPLLRDLLPQGTVLLDNTELLFSPQLAQQALPLLRMLARDRTLIVSWNGTLDAAGRLCYAVPGHAEYRTYDTPDALIVPARAAA